MLRIFFQTIRDLHANSVTVKMITGDSKNIALSIGHSLNIHRDCDTALSGKIFSCIESYN